MAGRVREGARAAAVPLAGLALTYVVFQLTPWGRRFDLLSYHGREGAGWKVRFADLALLEAISTGTLIAALVVLVLVAGLRGRWHLGLRSVAAVVGSILSAEVLKHLLPGQRAWTGGWRWLDSGWFPSGHTAIITSIALAVLSISSDRWRRRLVGPLVAWTAIATTATVTVGWHRPSDVLGSLFLATAWHRACTVREPAERRLRAMLPRPVWPQPAARVHAASWRQRIPRPTDAAIVWWVLACVLVLGAAAEGVLSGRSAGRTSELAYLVSLAGLLCVAGVAVATTAPTAPVPVRAPALSCRTAADRPRSPDS